MTDDRDSSPADVPTADPDQPDRSADPKTTEDGTEVRRTASPEQWEAVGRRALGDLLQARQAELDRAVGEVVATLNHGTPVDETHLKHLRDAIEGLEALVEQDLADLADLVPAATSYERGVGRGPVVAVADEFDVEPADLTHALKLVRNGDESAVDGPDGESVE